MGLRWGIVGLPNAGKSTLFNALSRTAVPVGAYPFTTIDPHVGVVPVRDPRLDLLAAKYRPQKVTPATLTIVDIAGLVRGAHEGEGLGNQFLSEIRSVDGIMMTLRFFEGSQVTHIEGGIDPERDRKILETELLLADLEWLERQREKRRRAAKSGDKKIQKRLELDRSLYDWMASEKSARSWRGPRGETAQEVYPELLSAKPVLYVLNVDEESLAQERDEEIAHRIDAKGEVIVLCAKLESDLTELSPEEQKLWLQETGARHSRLDGLIREGYRLLGAITFYTVVGRKEVRAWTILTGTTAAEAGGTIHTDFEKGFVKAEVLAYDDFIQCSSESEAQQKGLVRFEGRDYLVQDGDIIRFRFTP